MMQNLTPIAMPSIDKLFNDMKGLDPSILSKYVQDPDPNKKLAAMAALNSDKQIQQSAAAQQQPMPTVAQKLAQGVSQAPNMPTPGMPAVPPQAQAKPAAQGIAALQPQQTPPGSAMGILPTQSAPAPQGSPSGMPVAKAAGGIASFASGGHAQQSSQQAQIAQILSQLMQGINQDTIQPLPQQAQQTGIAAPDPGKANPMQNYASMVFGTRPQYRPGTEAAPISQDLSLSQMAQYSAQQPIAAAHGGLMHHVPEHMYQFKEGGILGFAGNEKQGSQANLSPAQLDAALSEITSNPGIIPGNTFSQARQAAGNTYRPIGFPSSGDTSSSAPPAPHVPPSRNIDANAINDTANAIMSDPGIAPSNTLAQAAAKAKNTYTPLKLDTGVQPQVRGHVTSPFQGVYDFFSNTGAAATNPRLGGTRTPPPAPAAPSAEAQANATDLLNNRNTLMNGQSNIPTPAAPAAPPAPPAPPTGGIAQTNAPVTTGTTAGGITEVLPKKEERRHEERRKEKAKEAAPAVAAAPEDKKSGIAAALVPPSETVTSLIDQTIKAAMKVDDAKKRLDDLAANKKSLGVNDEAGDSLAEQARHYDEEYKRQDKSMEHLLKVLNGIARGGLAGGGVEEENYQTAQRLSDEAHAEKYHDMIRQAKDKTRGEKLTDLNNITAAVDADRGKAGTLAANVYGTNTQAETSKKVEEMRVQSAMDVAKLNSGTQYAIAKLNRDATLAGREVTANEIADQLKSDDKYKNMSYAERMKAAFNIKTGLGDKLSNTDLLSRIKLETANSKDLILTQDERDEAKARLSVLNKQLDQASGLAPATSQYKEGDKSTSKSGKPIVYKNGQWEYV